MKSNKMADTSADYTLQDVEFAGGLWYNHTLYDEDILSRYFVYKETDLVFGSSSGRIYQIVIR